MPAFREIVREDAPPDNFAHFECVASTPTGLPAELAEVVRSLYVDERNLETILHEAASGLGAVADETAIRAFVDEVVAAVVPPGAAATVEGRDPPPAHLALSRNELGEVLAYLAAQDIFGTIVPAKRVRHKEVPGRPSRGMDLLGVDAEPLRIILGEVKTSTAAASPPPVVGDGDESLRAQLTGYMADRAKVLREIHWAIKYSADDAISTLAEALLLYIKGELPTVLFAALVRPAGVAATTDYGCFRDDPDQFRPGAVRFCLISLTEDIERLAATAYDLARHRA